VTARRGTLERLVVKVASLVLAQQSVTMVSTGQVNVDALCTNTLKVKSANVIQATGENTVNISALTVTCTTLRCFVLMVKMALVYASVLV
jgi:hypothetical protein